MIAQLSISFWQWHMFATPAWLLYSPEELSSRFGFTFVSILDDLGTLNRCLLEVDRRYLVGFCWYSEAQRKDVVEVRTSAYPWVFVPAWKSLKKELRLASQDYVETAIMTDQGKAEREQDWLPAFCTNLYGPDWRRE